MNYTKEAENFLHAIRPLRKITMIKELHDLSSGETAVLSYLHFQKDGVNAGELTEAFKTGTSRTAAILNGLEKKGFILRRPDPSDRRGTQVFITGTGKAEAVARQKEAAKHMAEFLEFMDPDDAKAFLAIAYRMIEKEKRKELGIYEVLSD